MSKLIITGQLLWEVAGGICGGFLDFVVAQCEEFTDLVEGEIPLSANVGINEALICLRFIDTHLRLLQFEIIGVQ